MICRLSLGRESSLDAILAILAWGDESLSLDNSSGNRVEGVNLSNISKEFIGIRYQRRNQK